MNGLWITILYTVNKFRKKVYAVLIRRETEVIYIYIYIRVLFYTGA